MLIRCSWYCHCFYHFGVVETAGVVRMAMLMLLLSTGGDCNVTSADGSGSNHTDYII